MHLTLRKSFPKGNKAHTVDKSIVSLSQPYIHPIFRGKLKAEVEFGAKLDLSIAEGGYAGTL